MFVRQTSVVATLFDPRAQNLDPWYEGLDKVDLVYLEKLRRCVLDTVRARRSPSAQIIASTLRGSGVCKTEFTDAQTQKIIASLVYDQQLARIGDIYYIAGGNRVGEALSCTPCGGCEYLSICDARGLGTGCVYMKQWLAGTE